MKNFFLSVLLLPVCALTAYPAAPLQIIFVDVEGGAATLIVTPAGESLLVDTGWPRDDARDARRIVKAAQHAGVKRIDHLFITHYHRDHWGGLAELAKLIPIGKFYDHGRMTTLAEDVKNFPQLNEAYLAAAKGQARSLRPGDEVALKRAAGSAPLRLRVMASNGEALTRAGAENPECKNAPLKEPDPSDNARSLGFVLELGDFRFLDLGDLTWNVEHKLACPSNVVGAVDLYQVTHHGADSSNNPVLLRSIKPRVAVMNNGPRKGGHPDSVKWLRSAGSVEDIYQGHRNLALGGTTGEGDNAPAELIANLEAEQECQGNAIQVSVSPDGASYTVTNGRTGNSKKYSAR